MNIVNPTDTTHNLIVIPRYGSPTAIVFNLYNEETQVSEVVANTFSYLDGYLTVSFDYDFIDGQKFQIKLVDTSVVVYRGKLMATTQTPQTFKAANELYYYE